MWQAIAVAPACAYEDQLTLGAGIGYAFADTAAGARHGVALQLDASLGLGPSWTGRAYLGVQLHPAVADSALFTRLGAGAELLYLLDLLEFVPYAGVGLDVFAGNASEPGTWRADFGLHPVLGIDWLLSREFILGLSARPVFVVTDWGQQPLYLTVLVTASLALDL
ncbi:MAG: hypothetical protein RL701_1567 [Pseudomonadota bacterium]|jgi:hypothetical protein